MEQTIERDDAGRLPGFGSTVVERHFDAPEAMDRTFYEIRAKSALNRVPNASAVPFKWTVNPYRGCSHACVYCFARPTHEYLEMDAGRDFERRIVVKVNVPEVLRAELARPSWRHEHVALGTNTDPYQFIEGRYKLTRGVLEALRDARNPCSVLTKSPLLVRDADVLEEIGRVADVSACLSVPTLDERAWRATEPHTPHPRARIEAVAELNRRGIPTGILIAPLMPGVNDAPAQVERIIELATEAGAVHVGGNTLFLQGPVRKLFFDWLGAHRPDLVPRYDRLYARGSRVPEAERRHIEHAAGLPGRRLKPYPDRFRHRSGAAHREGEGVLAFATSPSETTDTAGPTTDALASPPRSSSASVVRARAAAGPPSLPVASATAVSGGAPAATNDAGDLQRRLF